MATKDLSWPTKALSLNRKRVALLAPCMKRPAPAEAPLLRGLRSRLLALVTTYVNVGGVVVTPPEVRNTGPGF